jgi:hypothetical protein
MIDRLARRVAARASEKHEFSDADVALLQKGIHEGSLRLIEKALTHMRATPGQYGRENRIFQIAREVRPGLKWDEWQWVLNEIDPEHTFVRVDPNQSKIRILPEPSWVKLDQ